MAYKHYLLGVIADKPMSGYSMYKFFFEPFGRPLSQIYRTLTKMTKEGLIEVERVEQDRLPSQNVYHITKAGHSELMRWLKRSIPVKRSTENEAFGKLWFGEKAGQGNIVRNLKLFAKYAEKNLDFFKNQAKPLIEERGKGKKVNLDIVCRLLVIEYAIRQYETAVEWAHIALDKINSMSQEEGEAATTEAQIRKKK